MAKPYDILKDLIGYQRNGNVLCCADRRLEFIINYLLDHRIPFRLDSLTETVGVEGTNAFVYPANFSYKKRNIAISAHYDIVDPDSDNALG